MKTLLSNVIIAVILFASAPARAVMINGEFFGSVDSGNDINNSFGLGFGADLAGRRITGTFSFDTDAFNPVVNSTDHAVNALSIAPQLPATVTVTINGHTVTFVGNGISSLFVFQNTPAYLGANLATVDTTAFGIAISDPSNQLGTIVNYAKANSHTTIICDLNDLSTLGFNKIDGMPINGGSFPFGGEIFQGSGSTGPVILFSVKRASLHADQIHVNPIPSILLLIATGLGALGLLGWWRKRKQAAA